MGKLKIYRNTSSILNVHERTLPISAKLAGQILDSLASNEDHLWPHECWPAIELDHGLTIGSRGGHSKIRYCVSEYIPGRRVTFEFEPMEHLQSFVGRHFFEVITRPSCILLRHTIDAEIDPRNWFYWKIFIERIHDAVIEDAFDKAERFAGLPHPHTTGWSLYVRFLRRLRARQRAHQH